MHKKVFSQKKSSFSKSMGVLSPPYLVIDKFECSVHMDRGPWLVQFYQLSVSGTLCALVCQSFTVNIFKKSVFITFFSFYNAYFQIFTI